MKRWLTPLGGLLALIGYWGPWVNHPVAGLVVAGLDLGEYVKFLPVIRSGEIALWREGFYLPLLAVSLAFSLCAFRKEWEYGWPARFFLLALTVIAALNILPPAWTPALLLTPEFRLQTAGIALCLLAMLTSPFLALLPRRIISLLIALLALSAIWLPVQGFLRVLPDISQLYNRPLQPGWGLAIMSVGLLELAGVSLLEYMREMQPRAG